MSPGAAEGGSVSRPGVGGSAADASSLPGASVLVTGGTRGIGRAIALRLVADGAARAVLGYMRNDKAAEEAAALVQEAGAEPVLVRGNVADERVVAELGAAGPYRVVVHNAATGVIRAALETEDKHWDWTLNANARALLSLARVTAPEMEEGGSIVAISSLGSQRVLPNYVLIGTSKAALEAVVRYLGFDLAPRGIRVNCVSAGVVDTEALDWFPNKEQMLATVKRTPAGRLVAPEDVAAAVLVAARSEETGQAWAVQPGREPLRFRFPNLPGPRVEGAEGTLPPL